MIAVIDKWSHFTDFVVVVLGYLHTIVLDGFVSLKSQSDKWTLYDLQDKLKQGGWMVPAYTLPENIQNYVVMRIVVRQGFSRDMADMLLNDIRDAVASLEKLEYPTNTRIAQDKNIEVKGSVFTHTGNRHKTKK